MISIRIISVVRREFLAHPAEIEKAVNLPHQMTGWYDLVEIE